MTYPRLWCDRQGFRATAAAELRRVPVYLRLLQVMAGLIPLIGALLMMFAGPQELSLVELDSFRFLVAGLMILGLAGFPLAMFGTGLLAQAWAALTGSNETASRSRASSQLPHKRVCHRGHNSTNAWLFARLSAFASKSSRNTVRSRVLGLVDH